MQQTAEGKTRGDYPSPRNQYIADRKREIGGDRNRARRVQQHPRPVEPAKRSGVDAIEQIVSSDHATPPSSEPTRRKPHDQRHRNHAPAEYPDHSAMRPGNETPCKVNDREFEEKQPQAAREEES